MTSWLSSEINISDLQQLLNISQELTNRLQHHQTSQHDFSTTAKVTGECVSEGDMLKIKIRLWKSSNKSIPLQGVLCKIEVTADGVKVMSYCVNPNVDYSGVHLVIQQSAQPQSRIVLLLSLERSFTGSKLRLHNNEINQILADVYGLRAASIVPWEGSRRSLIFSTVTKYLEDSKLIENSMVTLTAALRDELKKDNQILSVPMSEIIKHVSTRLFQPSPVAVQFLVSEEQFAQTIPLITNTTTDFEQFEEIKTQLAELDSHLSDILSQAEDSSVRYGELRRFCDGEN